MLSADEVPFQRQILSPDSVSYWEPANSLLHLLWQSWQIPCHPCDSYDDFPMTFGDLRVINYCNRMSRRVEQESDSRNSIVKLWKYLSHCSFFFIFIITNLVFFLSISQMHSSLLALESARNAECIRFNLVRELMMLLADIVVKNDENTLCKHNWSVWKMLAN